MTHVYGSTYCWIIHDPYDAPADNGSVYTGNVGSQPQEFLFPYQEDMFYTIRNVTPGDGVEIYINNKFLGVANGTSLAGLGNRFEMLAFSMRNYKTLTLTIMR